MSWLHFVDWAPWDAALPQPSSVNTPQALEEVKGDDIIAVEKSLESEAWAQLWTLRITVSVRSRVRGPEEGVKVQGLADWTHVAPASVNWVEVAGLPSPGMGLAAT